MSIRDIREVLGLGEKASRAEYYRLKDIFDLGPEDGLSFFHFCVYFEKHRDEVLARIEENRPFKDLV